MEAVEETVQSRAMGAKGLASQCSLYHTAIPDT